MRWEERTYLPGVRVKAPASVTLVRNYRATDKYFVKENRKGGKEGER